MTNLRLMFSFAILLAVFAGLLAPFQPATAQDVATIPSIETSAEERTPEAIARSTRLAPFVMNGQLAGLMVVEIEDDSLLFRVGIRQRFVIRSINGQSFLPSDKTTDLLASNSDIVIEVINAQRAEQRIHFRLVNVP